MFCNNKKSNKQTKNLHTDHIYMFSIVIVYISRIYIVERIQISYFLALSRVATFYATTEQKLIHSFWNAVRIRRKINQLHQSFLDFFLYHPLIHVKLKKSTVEFHTSKNILKMIKQRNQSRQVLFYIEYTFIHFAMSISCKQGSLLISK
jgi:hypothetical protein